MCGLIGLATLRKDLNVLHLRKWLETATVISTLRGKDSTGIAVVDDPTNIAKRFKDTIPGWTFISTKQFDNALNPISANAYMIHTRSATVGGVSHDSAHPFNVGPITMEHNGTLTSNDHWVSSVNDSEWICQQLAGERTAAQVLSDLEGAYALVWHDARDGNIHLARNVERPLYYALSKDEKVLVWASEEWMLGACFARSPLALEMLDIRELPVGGIHKFDLTNPAGLLRPRITPFTPQESKRYSYYSQSNSYYNGKKVYQPANTSTNTNLTVVTPLLPKEIDIKKPVMFVAEEAIVNTTGSVLLIGPLIDESDEYIEASCLLPSKKEWNRYKNVKDPVFSGMVSSWKTEYYGKERTEATKYIHMALKDYKYCGTYAKLTKGGDITPTNTLDQIPGPNDTVITEAEFNRLAIDGCVMCQMPLYTADALSGGAAWTLDGFPICSTCSQQQATA